LTTYLLLAYVDEAHTYNQCGIQVRTKGDDRILVESTCIVPVCWWYMFKV